MATLRNLKIKTGICRRTLKELHSYVGEVEQESAKTISMKESNADAFDIKQQVLSILAVSLCISNAQDLLQKN
jgi:tubulin-specific chaperone A